MGTSRLGLRDVRGRDIKQDKNRSKPKNMTCNHLHL